MSHGLTREQFDAAELRVRRAMSLSDLGLQELCALDFVATHSFPLQRVAAYFRSFRQLGDATGLGSHAHAVFKRLKENNILIPLPYATLRFHWWGVNTTFEQWRKVKFRKLDRFWEQHELPGEPELAQLLREAFVENLSEASVGAIHVSTELSVRDAGPEWVPQSDIELARNKNPAPALLCTQPEAGTPATQAGSETPDDAGGQKPDWRADWQKMKREMFGNYSELPATLSVPESGTPDAGALYPVADCTQKGYSKSPNVDPGKVSAVPESGTSILAGPAVPAKKAGPASASGLRNWKPAITGQKASPEMAFEWIQAIDFSEGLRDPRYAKQWRKLCEENPAYVLDALPGVLLRQAEPIKRPLALLAHVARKDRMMR